MGSEGWEHGLEYLDEDGEEGMLRKSWGGHRVVTQK